MTVPRHITMPHGTTPVSMAIAATMKPVTARPSLVQHELVHDHDIPVLVQAEDERVRRERVRPDEQHTPGHPLVPVVPERDRHVTEPAGRLLTADQLPCQRGEHDRGIGQDLAG
jgi:hypothetical protein